MHPLLFRKWIPLPLRYLCIFILTITTLFLNGTYTGSSVDITGSMGVLREDISMAYYAASAGMAAAYPMVSNLRSILSTKTILLFDLILQSVLSYICANAQQIETITVCSFLIGFLKSFVMMEMILMLRPLFSPRNIRSEFYAYFYPLVFSVSQFSLIVTALIAYNFDWQYMYYFIILLILLSIICILVCFRFTNQKLSIPKNIDWYSFSLIAASFLITIYIFNYGKVNDWFSSPTITGAVILLPFLFFLMIRRQLYNEKPYINLKVFGNKKAVIAYLMMGITVLLTSSNLLISTYVNSIIHVDSYHSNLLNLGSIPGFIVGGFICFWWFRLQIFKFRTLAFWGMFSISIYLVLIYFGIATNTTYESLFIPMFFRGLGMMIIFIAFGVYAVESLPPQWMLYNAFFLVSIRSTLSPVIGSSLYSNCLYRLQYSMTAKLSRFLSIDTPLAESRYLSKYNQALSQGYSIEDATILATKSIDSILQLQTLIISMKTIFGILVIIALIFTIIARFTPFHRTLKVKAVKTGEDMV